MAQKFTQVRCHCCGAWQNVYMWNNKRPVYCDSCKVETDPTWRTGPGKGQCKACKANPHHLKHWEDPKPGQPMLHIYVR